MDTTTNKKGAPEAPENEIHSESPLYHPLRWRGEADPVKGWHDLGREAAKREKPQRRPRRKGGAR